MKKIVLIIVLFFIFKLSVSASYIVFDQDNLQTIDGVSIHEKRLIASITKVMSAYVIINNTNLNDYVTVGDEINNAHGSSIYLKKGEKIKVIDLLYGMMLRSGNDAAISLATYSYGSEKEFVKMMNYYVKKWGLKDTIFQNSTGLDDTNSKNISSAYDMAYITSMAMKGKTFRKIFKTKRHQVKTNLNVHEWINKNKTLFMDKAITGGKTGYTKKAKRTLITTSSKNNMNLVVVTLGEVDDFNFHVKKHNYVFDNYNNFLILNKNNLNIVDKKNKIKQSDYFLRSNYHLIIKKKDLKNLSIKYIMFKNNKKSEIAGKVEVYYKSNIIYEDPIYLRKNKSIVY